MLGYILGLLKGFKYLRKTGDFIGDNLTLRLLQRTLVLDVPRKSTEDAENKLILAVGNKVGTLLFTLIYLPLKLYQTLKSSIRIVSPPCFILMLAYLKLAMNSYK